MEQAPDLSMDLARSETEVELLLSRISEAKRCLESYGQAIRGDWSEMDGRSIRDSLDEIAVRVLSGEWDHDRFCDKNGIVDGEWRRNL